MTRGGSRQGQPGHQYPQRKDMRQPVRVITGQQYGQAQALANAQREIPLPNNTNVPSAGPTEQPPISFGVPVPPGGMGDFARPTERPAEPVTAGLPTGPGPGPEALTGSPAQPDTVGTTLRALYQANPNNDLLRLIELHDQGY